MSLIQISQLKDGDGGGDTPSGDRIFTITEVANGYILQIDSDYMPGIYIYQDNDDLINDLRMLLK